MEKGKEILVDLKSTRRYGQFGKYGAFSERYRGLASVEVYLHEGRLNDLDVLRLGIPSLIRPFSQMGDIVNYRSEKTSAQKESS